MATKKRNFIDVLRMLGPVVLALIPGAEKYAPLVLAGAEIAESAATSGVNKKQIALDSVVLGAQTVNTIKGSNEVINPDEARVAAENIFKTVEDVVNLVGDVKDNLKSAEEQVQ